MHEIAEHEIAEFLRHHPPFDTLDEEELAAVASSAEVESYPGRATILDSAAATSESAYVVRRGSVELMIEGRLLDLLGEGEMFGFASLLEEQPMGFVARAAEDALVLTGSPSKRSDRCSSAPPPCASSSGRCRRAFACSRATSGTRSRPPDGRSAS